MNRSIQRRDRGFTATELFIAICGLLSLAGTVALVWVAVHYIIKYW